MGVFGQKTSTKPAFKAKPVKKGVKPVLTLRIKRVGNDKSEYLTGLFEDTKQPEQGSSFSGKTKTGDRYVVYINADNSGSLLRYAEGSKESERLTKLFYNEEGQFGPYFSGKGKNEDRYYVAEYKPRED